MLSSAQVVLIAAYDISIHWVGTLILLSQMSTNKKTYLRQHCSIYVLDHLLVLEYSNCDELYRETTEIFLIYVAICRTRIASDQLLKHMFKIVYN